MKFMFNAVARFKSGDLMYRNLIGLYPLDIYLMFVHRDDTPRPLIPEWQNTIIGWSVTWWRFHLYKWKKLTWSK